MHISTSEGSALLALTSGLDCLCPFKQLQEETQQQDEEEEEEEEDEALSPNFNTPQAMW